MTDRRRAFGPGAPSPFSRDVVLGFSVTLLSVLGALGHLFN